MENTIESTSQRLISHLESLVPLSEKDRLNIPLLFREAQIQKGDHFLRQGETQERTGFIVNGLFRYYYLDHEGNEHTKHFVTDNEFVLSLSALITRQPSLFFIQALETSTLMTIPAETVLDLISRPGVWQTLYLKLLEQSYLIKEERSASFLLKNAEERYLDFTERYPALAHRIKRYQLASYLGIKPESLSRIKKSLNV